VTDGAEPGSPVYRDGTNNYTPGIAQHGGGTHKYFHVDALGSTRGITNSTSAATDGFLYDAFGNVMSRSGTTATPVQHGGAKGYQTDAESGLMLLGYRYYDASIGRFITRDPARYGDNWYAYCGKNPLVMTDPSGLDPFWEWMRSRAGEKWFRFLRIFTFIVGVSDNCSAIGFLDRGLWHSQGATLEQETERGPERDAGTARPSRLKWCCHC